MEVKKLYSMVLIYYDYAISSSVNRRFELVYQFIKTRKREHEQRKQARIDRGQCKINDLSCIRPSSAKMEVRILVRFATLSLPLVNRQLKPRSIYWLRYKLVLRNCR
jgi:hypothetical protein